jgi:hypothetical protein
MTLLRSGQERQVEHGHGQLLIRVWKNDCLDTMMCNELLVDDRNTTTLTSL